MLVTAETSQDPIGPCGPLEQSLDSLRHSTIAALSAGPRVGDHPVVGVLYRLHGLCKGYCHGEPEVNCRVTIVVRVRY